MEESVSRVGGAGSPGVKELVPKSDGVGSLE
jgi:hypothetical protein